MAGRARYAVYQFEEGGKEKLFDGEDLEEIARVSAEKSGVELDTEGLLDFGGNDDG